MRLVMTCTDYERMAATYDSGRELPLQWLDTWRVVLSEYLASPSLPVLDLGSGTGLFSEALATWFDAEVVAVEPSEAMRHEAARKRPHPRIAYVGGQAEHIPLKGRSCDSAWLSTVIHHIRDLRACAHELRRVLRPGGPVIIRNSFSGRCDGITWLRFFPAARRLAEARWPTVEATVAALGDAGFEVELVESIPEVKADDLGAYCERIRTRTNSTLALISDEEFDKGISSLEKAAAQEAGPAPVVDQRDLLLFR